MYVCLSVRSHIPLSANFIGSPLGNAPLQNRYPKLPYSPIWFPLIPFILHHLNAPSWLLSYSSHNLLHVPLTTTAIGRKAFSFAAPASSSFGIPSHSVSGNHHLLASSNVISKLIYLPSPASPFSHPATAAPPTRACFYFCAIQILVIIIIIITS